MSDASGSYRYRVLRELGTGGLGTTYHAKDLVRGEELALKVLHHPTMARRDIFLEEFAALRELLHPNLVRVRDFGYLHEALSAEKGGDAETPSSPCPYFTSRLVRGPSLSEWALECKSEQELRARLVDVLRALDYLHRAGRLHADIKPDNVLVAEHAYLIDLSCSCVLGQRSDSLAGTRGYLSPERLRGEAAAPSDDIYAFGRTVAAVLPKLSFPLSARFREWSERLHHQDRSKRPGEVGELLEFLGAATRIESFHRALPRTFVGRESHRRLLSAVVDSLVGSVVPSSEVLRREPRVETDSGSSSVSDPPGESRFVLLHGTDGCGRTRLLQELLWDAQLRVQVLDLSGASPMRAMLRALQPRTGDPSRIDTVQRDRWSWFWAVDDAERTRTRPLLLIVDDAHQLDADEQQLFAALLRVLPSWPRTALLATSDHEYAEKLRSGGFLETDAGDRAGRPPCVMAALPVEALERAELERWLHTVASPTQIDRLLAATGGYPGTLARVLQAPGTLESKLAVLDASAQDLGGLSVPSSAQGEEQQRVLALVAGMRGRIDEDTARQLGVSLAVLRELIDDGLLQLDGDVFRLLKPIEADAIFNAFPEAIQLATAASLRAFFGRRAENHGRPEDLANAVYWCALQRDLKATRAFLLQLRERAAECPTESVRAGRMVLVALARAPQDLGSLSLAAACLRATGHVRDLLALLAKVRRRASASQSVLIAIAEACAQLGQPRRALRYLPDPFPAHLDSEVQARLFVTKARSLMRLGEHAAARDAAVEGQSAVEQASLPWAEMRELEGIAQSYLGEAEKAKAALEEASGVHRRREHTAGLQRSTNGLAFCAYRAGDIERAAELYAESLALSEARANPELMAAAALNLGTANHQLGRWGEAFESYEKGLRAALLTGKISTEISLLFNQARLYLDMASVERAQARLADAKALAKRSGSTFFVSACAALEAELCFMAGMGKKAKVALGSARKGFLQAGLFREVAEVDLLEAEGALLLGDLAWGRAAHALCVKHLQQIAASDVAAKAQLVHLRLVLAEDGGERAGRLVDETLNAVAQVGQLAVFAEAEALAAQIYDALGATNLAERHRSRAIEVWERIATSLPTASRPAFWSHPKRRELRVAKSHHPEGGRNAAVSSSHQPSRREARLLRLLEMNKRLNASLHVKKVLTDSMEAAVELTGAERGFVILDRQVLPEIHLSLHPVVERDEDLFVAAVHAMPELAARGDGSLFSRSIARRVLTSGEAIITVDAENDDRFGGQASVHAMSLKSVLSVPIHVADRMLGALYLDYRFKPGHFNDEDVELLIHLATQVAIALSNAALHQQLQRRTRELEAEQQRVAELLRDQAETIDDLQLRMKHTQKVLEYRFRYEGIVGRSPAMRKVFHALDRIVDSTLDVLITGESGTGKELIARAIHYNSERRDGAFVAVNCGAIPENLIESELFGHVRGAFTGAERDKLGLVRESAGGTLFLDELGELPLAMQVKLLRVLQEREVRPVGSHHVHTVDLRVVCATNRNLRAEIEAGRFREDLFFRVSVVEVSLPPLRERPEDIPELVRRTLERLGKELGRGEISIAPKAMRMLLKYPWPGNVRELENLLTKAVVLADDEHRLVPRDIDLEGRARRVRVPQNREEFQQSEAERLRDSLQYFNWNVSEVSRELGIPRATLYRKMKRYGINR